METQIIKAEAIEAINKSEIDIAISTAKEFPRDLRSCIEEIETIACLNKQTAEECFYALPRREKQKDGSFKTKLIEGPSVRLAEIVVYSWGNINAGFRIVANDGKKITAQAVCHDLQRNVRVQIEVDRRITTKNGYTFNEDMQIVTGNAAGSIALRNAILRVIPKAIIAEITDKIKKVAIGKAIDLETSRTKAIEHFTGLGVDEKVIFSTIGVRAIDEIGPEQVFTLRGIANAINEGSTTVEDAFGLSKQSNEDDKKIGEEIKDEIADDIAATLDGDEKKAKPKSKDNSDLQSNLDFEKQQMENKTKSKSNKSK